MINFNDLMSMEGKQQGESCKGRIYRYKESAYITPLGDWCAKQSMALMKRMSCSGCVDCGGLIELLEQTCYPEEVILPDSLKQDGLYILDLEKDDPGYYGCPDVDCYPEFIEYKEYTVKAPAPIKQIDATFYVKFDE